MWSYWQNQVFSGTLVYLYLQDQQKDKITDTAETDYRLCQTYTPQ